MLDAISKATSLVGEGAQWIKNNIFYPIKDSPYINTIVKSPTHAMYALNLGRSMFVSPIKEFEAIEAPIVLANIKSQQELEDFVDNLFEHKAFFDLTENEKVFLNRVHYKKLQLDENLEEEHCILLSQLIKKFTQALKKVQLENAHIDFISGLYLQGNFIEALASGNPVLNAISTGIKDLKKAAKYYYHDKPTHALEALFNGAKSILVSSGPFAALLQAGLSNQQTFLAVLLLHMAIYSKWHNKIIDLKKIFTKDRQQALYNYYLALMEGKFTKAEHFAKELLTKHHVDVNDFSLLSEIEEVAITYIRDQMLNILVRGLLNNMQKYQHSKAQNLASFDGSLRHAKYLKEQTKYVTRLKPYFDLTAANAAELDHCIQQTRKPAVKDLLQQLKDTRHQAAAASLAQSVPIKVPHLKARLEENKQLCKELNILLENYTFDSELYQQIYNAMTQLQQEDPFKFLGFQRKIAACDPLLSLKIFMHLGDKKSEMVYCNQDTLQACLKTLRKKDLLQIPFYQQECVELFTQLLQQPDLARVLHRSLSQVSSPLRENLLEIAQKHEAVALQTCIQGESVNPNPSSSQHVRP